MAHTRPDSAVHRRTQPDNANAPLTGVCAGQRGVLVRLPAGWQVRDSNPRRLSRLIYRDSATSRLTCQFANDTTAVATYWPHQLTGSTERQGSADERPRRPACPAGAFVTSAAVPQSSQGLDELRECLGFGVVGVQQGERSVTENLRVVLVLQHGVHEVVHALRVFHAR